MKQIICHGKTIVTYLCITIYRLVEYAEVIDVGLGSGYCNFLYEKATDVPSRPWRIDSQVCYSLVDDIQIGILVTNFYRTEDIFLWPGLNSHIKR